MPMSKMYFFSVFSLLLLFGVLHQSHCRKFERFVDDEPKDSLACYKTLTLELFQNLKKVVREYCVQDGENEFKSKIKPRTQKYSLITKDGQDKDLFVKGKKEAEKIGSKTLDKIRSCLSHNCSEEARQEVNKFTKMFRKGSLACGDSEYLGSAITTLEETCTGVKYEKMASDMKSFFKSNSDSYGMNDWWA